MALGPLRNRTTAIYAAPLYGHENALPFVVFVTVLCRRYSCMPASPHSLPNPEAFQPPKGVCGARETGSAGQGKSSERASGDQHSGHGEAGGTREWAFFGLVGLCTPVARAAASS